MSNVRGSFRFQLQAAIFLTTLAILCPAVWAQAQNADFNNQVDRIAQQVLGATGVPSASVAIVRGNQVAYTHAYGEARLDAKVPATPEMRYSIGSISKQFTATAILMLAEEGKLSL
ncbi:MAG TPA: serine hydrolase domain-containing protein, partial [Terriglobales bacterium]|nr:serine hydrolase domain-containing protein [Terriglobales bacterium]